MPRKKPYKSQSQYVCKNCGTPVTFPSRRADHARGPNIPLPNCMKVVPVKRSEYEEAKGEE